MDIFTILDENISSEKPLALLEFILAKNPLETEFFSLVPVFPVPNGFLCHFFRFSDSVQIIFDISILFCRLFHLFKTNFLQSFAD